ncbi:MAG: AAA family ATPase [Ruminococcus sp.]|nr:AAA family ATPase [Ruminococcus sp.]
MNKPYVLLADLDANYLVPLEDKLTEELYDQIELEIITDKHYFDTFFSTPRKVDTLIVSADLFSQDLLRHNVTDFFILTETSDDIRSSDNITRIFKYSSTKEIYNQILYKNKEILSVQFSHKETQVIVVTSAIGGSGKTTVSLALSDSLARSHKRVLYVNTDVIQGFSFYLQNKSTLPNEIVNVFNGNEELLYSDIVPYLRNEDFTYLPPLSRSVFSLGLDSNVYNRIINAAKAAKAFDYIIVDSDMCFDDAKTKMINDADKVIITVLQDAYSTHKTECFLRSVDCRNNEKFIFVCNKFRRDLDNDYMMSEVGRKCIITEYIDDVPLHKIHSLDSFTELLGIRNLAYIFS